jgi:DNA-directed RNA polymerase beta subunit
MLRSSFCILADLGERELYDLNECPYDSGGYFIINGSEKVLIAQERMATNHVYVFAKAQPSPINFLAEIRSAVEKGGKTISQFQVKMFHRNQEKTVRPGSMFGLLAHAQFATGRKRHESDHTIYQGRYSYLGRLPSPRRHVRPRHS